MWVEGSTRGGGGGVGCPHLLVLLAVGGGKQVEAGEETGRLSLKGHDHEASRDLPSYLDRDTRAPNRASLAFAL